MQVVLSATLSRLLPQQLGFIRFQHFSFKLNLVCWDQNQPFNMRPSSSCTIQCAALVKIVTSFLAQ